MKCRKCGEKAAFNMPQHKLALCREHYLDWLPAQTQRFIDKYGMFETENRILLAVSGGKDSLALWDVLDRLDYQVDGLYIGLGIDGGVEYSRQSHRYAVQFAEARGLSLIVVDVENAEGAAIPLAAELTLRGRGKPCSLCGMTRRHIMNQVALDGGYDVLATGHNLDDEAAVLLGNTLTWSPGYLIRQGPVLEGSEDAFVRKVKPFCRFYERETAAYALLQGIEYEYEECPHSVGAKSIYYKELLNRLEHDRPGAKLNFYLSFLRAKEQGLFAPDRDPGYSALHRCSTCGQPTSVPGECAYCRTWSQVRASLPERVVSLQ